MSQLLPILKTNFAAAEIVCGADNTHVADSPEVFDQEQKGYLAAKAAKAKVKAAQKATEDEAAAANSILALSAQTEQLMDHELACQRNCLRLVFTKWRTQPKQRSLDNYKHVVEALWDGRKLVEAWCLWTAANDLKQQCRQSIQISIADWKSAQSHRALTRWQQIVQDHYLREENMEIGFEWLGASALKSWRSEVQRSHVARSAMESSMCGAIQRFEQLEQERCLKIWLQQYHIACACDLSGIHHAWKSIRMLWHHWRHVLRAEAAALVTQQQADIWWLISGMLEYRAECFGNWRIGCFVKRSVLTSVISTWNEKYCLGMSVANWLWAVHSHDRPHTVAQYMKAAHGHHLQSGERAYACVHYLSIRVVVCLGFEMPASMRAAFKIRQKRNKCKHNTGSKHWLD